MKEIEKIVAKYHQINWEKEQVALGTVVKVEGSAYRRIGARMFVRMDCLPRDFMVARLGPSLYQSGQGRRHYGFQGHVYRWTRRSGPPRIGRSRSMFYHCR